jgi:hypothetical protein
MRGYRSGQRRGATPLTARPLKCHSAIEPVIGHMKDDGRLERNFLRNRQGGRLNAILAGVGQNFASSAGGSNACSASWAGCSKPAHLAGAASPEAAVPFLLDDDVNAPSSSLSMHRVSLARVIAT